MKNEKLINKPTIMKDVPRLIWSRTITGTKEGKIKYYNNKEKKGNA